MAARAGKSETPGLQEAGGFSMGGDSAESYLSRTIFCMSVKLPDASLYKYTPEGRP